MTVRCGTPIEHNARIIEVSNVVKRAIGLAGGGLDSRLAFEAMRRAGYEVEGIHFETGFVRETHRPGGSQGSLTVVDVRQRYLEEVVSAPRHGYGSGMNPCHDCRAFFLREAEALARERGIETLFTGDVIGQRSHDQSHRAFEIAEQDSKTTGRVVRPLSAGHLNAVEGFDPQQLPDGCGTMQGRSRRAQLALAKAWGLDSYPTPSGRCCRLADPAYGRRLRDYLDHLDRAAGQRPEADQLPLLSLGRHFRLAWDLKLVLSRSHDEWQQMQRLQATQATAQPLDVGGASALIEGPCDGDRERRIAAVVAAHARLDSGQRCEVLIEHGGRQSRLTSVAADTEDLEVWRI